MTSFNVFVRLVNSTRTRCYQLSDAFSRSDDGDDDDDYKKGEREQNVLLNRLKALVETREGIPRDAQVFLSVETTFFFAKSKEGEKRDAASASGSSSSSCSSSFSSSSLDEENFLSRRKRIEPNGTYQLFLKKGLQGGKGGFGTLLRSTGKKKGRNSGANNNELCRDLKGQRYHVTENAKKMEQWEKEESLREEEALALRYIEEQTGEKARKRAKMEEEEERFRKDSEEVKERMEKAIKMATNATKISTTLASSSVEKRSKRDEEDDDDKDDEDDDDDDDEDDFRKKKKKTSTTKNDRGEKEKKEERKEEEKPKEVEEKEQRKEEKVAASEKKLTSAATSSSPPKQENFEPIDLSVINTAQELERFGLDHLKIELTRQKLKCGGSLEERANRLFLLKTNSLEEIDKKHKAKK